MQDSLGAEYLADVQRKFRWLKEWADKAVERVTDQELFATLDPEANSIALLVKHLAGNMRARWRAPFESDGEATRGRDNEFVIQRGRHAERASGGVGNGMGVAVCVAGLPRAGRFAENGRRPVQILLDDADDQPPVDPLCDARRADRVLGQAFRRERVGISELATRETRK